MSVLHNYYTIDLDEYRTSGDDPADHLWTSHKPSEINAILRSLERNKEIAQVRMARGFLNKVCMEPSWKDQSKIDEGQNFFYKYTQEILGLLGLAALPYCYAHKNGAKVLVQSDRIRREISNRLLETAKFVFDVCTPGAFKSDQAGYVSILKVRLIHSAIRHHVQKEENWSNDMYGMPVNQEDMAGTNLAFSLITIRALRKLGISVNDREANAFIHLWNYISYKMGLDEALCPNDMRAASTLAAQIFRRQVGYSEEGQGLTNTLVMQMEKQATQNINQKRIEQLIHFLLEKEAAKAIGISNNSSFFEPIRVFNGIRYFGSNKGTFNLSRSLYDQQNERNGKVPVLKVPSSLR